VTFWRVNSTDCHEHKNGLKLVLAVFIKLSMSRFLTSPAWQSGTTKPHSSAQLSH
jgi:hypothetical protein